MTKEKEKQGRHIYIDMIRVIACVLVILIHVSASGFQEASVKTAEWFFLNMFNCIGMNGVPLFFMISGALILNPGYRMSLKKLFVQKIGKVAVAYYLTLLFYNFLPFIKGWVAFKPSNIKECLLKAVIYGEGVYHLWFIPVLLVLYLLSPILKEAFLSKKTCEYYLVLFSVVGMLLPTILLFDLPGPIRHFISYYYDKLSLFMLTGYIGYFVLGHYLHLYMEGLSEKRLIFVWTATIATSLFTILTCFSDSIAKGYPSSITNSPLTANVLISSSGIFLLLKHYGQRLTSESCRSWLQKLSACTFGVYLLHPFVMELIFECVNLGFSIGMFAVTAISFLLVFLLRKMVLDFFVLE